MVSVRLCGWLFLRSFTKSGAMNSRSELMTLVISMRSELVVTSPCEAGIAMRSSHGFGHALQDECACNG